MPPSVDGDAEDVDVRVEPAWSEHPRELVLHPGFEVLEGHVIEDLASSPELTASIEPPARHCRHVHEVQHHGLVRRARELVFAHADRVIELEAREEPHRVRDLVHAEPDPWMPVPDEHLHVAQGRLDVLPQRHPLALRQRRHDRGNHHVVPGQHAVPGADPAELACVHVPEVDAVVAVRDVDHGARESQPRT